MHEPLIEGKAGYSADEFDSDSEDHAKTPVGLNKFVVSLGKAEEDVDGLLQHTSSSRGQPLQDTSRFGGEQLHMQESFGAVNA